MRLIFQETIEQWNNFLPLTFTKPISELRLGILTIREKWEKHLLKETAGFITKEYLQPIYNGPTEGLHLFINSTILPNQLLVEAISKLTLNQALIKDGIIIAHLKDSTHQNSTPSHVSFNSSIDIIRFSWDLIRLNHTQISIDFKIITKNRLSQPLPEKCTYYGEKDIFIEEGAKLYACTINAENGPVYIGKNAIIHEGSTIKGPFSLCNDAHVPMGAKIREGCTIGIHAVGGGELKNSIIGDYSNKGHDGYLGDSIIGNWCNLGALTNVSNLKNTYSDIKVWNRTDTKWLETGTNKLGCIIGDYTHTGISTLLNTGTVIEPFCQITGSGFHPKFISAFQWGEPKKYVTYRFEKAIQVAKKIKTLKGHTLLPEEESIMKSIFDMVKI